MEVKMEDNWNHKEKKATTLNTFSKTVDKQYKVLGTCLDSNGCEKTYGVDSKGRDCESFCTDTDYTTNL